MKSQEALYFWTVCRDFRECLANGDQDGARLAKEELEAIAMHANDASIRQRAAVMAERRP
jgi:hypothetical protein